MDTIQNMLSQAADEYLQKGYQVALCSKKSLLVQIFSGSSASSIKSYWDGISIILDLDMVCVDFDTPEFGFEKITGDVWAYPMPPSWKEETNRGWHVFYRLPVGKYRTRIHWKPSVDLLVFDNEQSTHYAKEKFFGHVLCSPTKYYRRECPENLPAKSELAMAPDWLIEAVSR